MRKIIDYNPQILVTNLEQLPKGTGSRFLLTIEGIYEQPKEYIAKRWLRKLPEHTNRGEAIIRFP